MAKKNNFDELNKLINKSNVGNKTNASFQGNQKPDLNDLLNKPKQTPQNTATGQTPNPNAGSGKQGQKQPLSIDEFFKQNIAKQSQKQPEAKPQPQKQLSAAEQLELLKRERAEKLAQSKPAQAPVVADKKSGLEKDIPSSKPTADKTPLSSAALPQKTPQTRKELLKNKKQPISKDQQRLLDELHQLEQKEQALLEMSEAEKASATKTQSNKPISSLDDLLKLKEKQSNKPASDNFASATQTPKNAESANLIKSLEEMAKGFSGNSHADEIKEVSEQKEELLDQLRRLQEGQEEEPEDKRKRRGFMWIFFLGTSLAMILFFGIWIVNMVIQPPYEYVRINVNINNKDVLFTTNENGEKVPIQVNPGETVSGLDIYARNSKNKGGDKDNPIWNSVFLRFKILMIVDNQEVDNLVEIFPDTNLWHRYNEAEEEEFTQNGRPGGTPIVVFDDGYYYYKNVLKANEEVLMVDEIKFSLHNVTEHLAGKSVSIVVQVEVLENFSIIEAGYWADAPRKWMSDLRKTLEMSQTTDLN